MLFIELLFCTGTWLLRFQNCAGMARAENGNSMEEQLLVKMLSDIGRHNAAAFWIESGVDKREAWYGGG